MFFKMVSKFYSWQYSFRWGWGYGIFKVYVNIILGGLNNSWVSENLLTQTNEISRDLMISFNGVTEDSDHKQQNFYNLGQKIRKK